MKKSTIIAVVVFAGLLVAVVLSTQEKTERGITRISFAAVDSDSVDRISISGKNPIEIKKQDQVWILGDGRPADPAAVERLLETVPKIESSDLVTRQPERFAELEVDDEKGTRVTAFAGEKKLAELTVGKSASGGTYIRVDDAVYNVARVYPYVFSKNASAWHKLKLFDLKLDQVARLEVRPAGADAYALIKKDDKWVLEDPGSVPADFRFDSDAARSLVSAVVSTRAQEIVLDDPGVEKTKLDAGTDVLIVEDKAGGRHELHLGGTGEKKAVYARVAGSQDVYLLSEWTARNQRKKAVDLRDLSLIELDVDKVTRLSIADGKRKLELEKQGAEWKIARSTETVPDDFELDPQAVTRRLQSLSRAQALALSSATSPAKTGLHRPQASVAVSLEDGKRVTLAFGAETKSDERDAVFAKGNVDDAVYLVAKHQRGSLAGGLNTFRKRAAPSGGMPAIDPQALSKLPPEVRAQLMRQMQQKQQQQKMIEALQAKTKTEDKKKASAK